MTPAPPTDSPNPPLTRAARRRNRIIAVTVLVVVWVLLWGHFTVANILSGLVVAAIVIAVFPLPPVTFAGRLHPVGMLRFWARFLSDLVVASIQIAWLAFRPGHVPRSAIIAVPLRVNTDLNLTLTAEALSLVPGSLILEADRNTGTLFVHVINVNSIDEVEQFRREVLALEARIIEAIGSADELRRVRENPDPTPPADLEGAAS
ncbi:Na+/H+ antiporter subunit E [Micromonospora sp. NPDC047793]|uniref:Na+/H+ antiporter subunit E n=1 Tax=unclassified Micromonospora TaxID=2617518 RepID=UPI001034DA5D|nr:Na+/H+ antiporter subunit E [Verrucosispora sp. SN26_14.1]TBL35056.1 Na+/H+ antiporter subunit E [Verrucosispora sp. SN26_14.1]